MEEMKKLSNSRKRSIENLEEGEALYFDCKYGEDREDNTFSHYFIAKCTYLELAKKYLKYEPLMVGTCARLGITLEDALKPLEMRESAITPKYQLMRLVRGDKHVQIMSFDDLNDSHVVKGMTSIFGMFAPVIYSNKQKKISVKAMCDMIDEYVGE